MSSETSKMHQEQSSTDITCGLITLSDSRKSEKLDLSGKYIAEEIQFDAPSESFSLPASGYYDKNSIYESYISLILAITSS